MKFTGIIAFSVATLLSSGANSQSLAEISDFAESICGDIPSGSYSKSEIAGKVQANIGYLAKLIDGGVEADGNRVTEVYEGIPFDRLPDSIPTVAMCKSELVKVLLERREARINTCRHPDFGQEGWIRSEEYTNSSGRVGGGLDQNWWCNQMVAQFLGSRKIGSQYTWQKIRSWEESNKDWKGDVTYKYHCEIKVQWEPLYVEKKDPRCGVSYF